MNISRKGLGILLAATFTGASIGGSGAYGLHHWGKDTQIEVQAGNRNVSMAEAAADYEAGLPKDVAFGIVFYGAAAGVGTGGIMLAEGRRRRQENQSRPGIWRSPALERAA